MGRNDIERKRIIIDRVEGDTKESGEKSERRKTG